MPEELSWKKIFSGKYFFTILTGFVFLYAVYAKVLNGEQIYGVIMMVIAAYFSKPAQPPTNGGTQ